MRVEHVEKLAEMSETLNRTKSEILRLLVETAYDCLSEKHDCCVVRKLKDEEPAAQAAGSSRP